MCQFELVKIKEIKHIKLNHQPLFLLLLILTISLTSSEFKFVALKVRSHLQTQLLLRKKLPNKHMINSPMTDNTKQGFSFFQELTRGKISQKNLSFSSVKLVEHVSFRVPISYLLDIHCFNIWTLYKIYYLLVNDITT